MVSLPLPHNDLTIDHDPAVPSVIAAEREPVEPTTETHVVPAPDEVARSRWTRWAVPAVVVIAAIALVTVVALNELGTHHRLATTRTHLAATQSDLTATQANLQKTSQDLASRTSERDALQSQLTSTQTELSGVKGTLSSAQNQISVQASELTELKTCFDGFATALQDDLYGDYSAGLSALESVQTACQAAQNALGG